MGMEDYSAGHVLLAAFNDEQIDAIFDAVNGRPDEALAKVRELRSKCYLPAALGFIQLDITSEEMANIMRGVAAVTMDFITAEWTAEHFTSVLVNGTGVPQNVAESLVNTQVLLSPVGDLKQFLGKFFHEYLPTFLELTPAAPLGVALHLADLALDQIMAKYKAPSFDAIPELHNLGKVLRDLGLRAKLQGREREVQGASALAGQQIDPADIATLSQIAIPMIGKAILRLAAAKSAGGQLPALGGGYLPQLTAEAGDALADSPRADAVHKDGTAIMRTAVHRRAKQLKHSAAPALNKVASAVNGASTSGDDAIETLAAQPLPGTPVSDETLGSAVKAMKNARGPQEFADWLRSVAELQVRQ